MKPREKLKGVKLSKRYREYATERMKAVRAEIERQGISLMELAIRSKMSYWTLWRNWHGKTVPTQKTLNRMERALGIRQKNFQKNRLKA